LPLTQKSRIPATATNEGWWGLVQKTPLGIEEKLRIKCPGLDKALIEELVAKPMRCPYSNATRRKYDVTPRN